MAISLALGTTELFLGSIILLTFAALFFYIVKMRNKIQNEKDKVENIPWPLGVNENLITNAERSFMGVLKIFTGDQYMIFPKVNLNDVLFIQKGTAPKLRQNIQNRINRKHLDFLLLDANTFKPVYAIELDDSSHQSVSAQRRDLVKDKALKDAGLRMIRIPAKATYTHTDIVAAFNESTLAQLPQPITIATTKTLQESEILSQLTESVICPKCSVPMVLRKSTKGANAGIPFYGCANYPHCREIISTVKTSMET
jgi:very-short-patch-repair endonuclease